MKLLLGWLTFFVVLYLYPTFTLVGLLCIAWAVMIWAIIRNSGMGLKATIAGWLVGIATFVFLFTIVRPFSGVGLCSDGWASPSIGRQGACSHHGGVSNRGGGAATVILFASVYAGHLVAKKLDSSD